MIFSRRSESVQRRTRPEPRRFQRIYWDGELDEVLEFIDRHEDAIEELDRLFVPLVDEIVMLLRLKVGVTGRDEELVPLFTAIGFFSSTLLHLLGLCWIALISPVIGLRLIAVRRSARKQSFSRCSAHFIIVRLFHQFNSFVFDRFVSSINSDFNYFVIHFVFVGTTRMFRFDTRF